MLKIAIIDSGLPIVSKSEGYRIIIDENFESYLSLNNIYDEEGHGSIVYKIIEQYMNKKDSILSLKVLNSNLKGSSLALISAIEYCITQNINIINISLGTTNDKYKEKLHRVIKKAVEKNIIIVAADSNENIISYPASFDEVVNVKKVSNKIILTKNKNIFEINIDKNSKVLYIEELDKDYCISGNSFIAPHITGALSKILK